MAVQRVVRPDQNFRGYAGQIASGIIRPGDEVLTLPSGRRTRVRRIVDLRRRSGSGARAHVGDADAGRRNRHQPRRHDRSRDADPQSARSFDATMVWFDAKPLDPAHDYLVKHTSHTGSGAGRIGVRHLSERRDARKRSGHESGDERDRRGAHRHGSRPLFFDPYRDQSRHGKLHSDRPETNATGGRGHDSGGAAVQGSESAADRLARLVARRFQQARNLICRPG